MKKITFFLFTIVTLTASAQAPAIEWQHTLGGNATDLFEVVLPTVDGGYIVGGQSDPILDDIGYFDIWLVKFNSMGVVQWQNTYGGSDIEGALGLNLLQTPDGGYIMSAITYSHDGDITGFHGLTDMWIVKVSSLGAIQWQKTMGGPGTDSLTRNCMHITSDGGYIFAGTTDANGGDVTGFQGGSDIWVVKTDSDGIIQWTKTIGGSVGESLWSIETTLDGGYILAGVTNAGNTDYLVIKLTADGNLQWQKTLGGTGIDVSFFAQQTTDGGYIVVGTSNSVNGDVTPNSITNGNDNVWVVKLNAEGHKVWDKALGRTEVEFTSMRNSIMETSDAGFIITGSSITPNLPASLDFYVARLDAAGTLAWERFLGGSLNDQAYDIVAAADGGYVISGVASSNDGDVSGNNGGYDIWVVKLNANGIIQWQKPIGGAVWENIFDISNTPDGGYIIAGMDEVANGNGYIVKLSSEALSAPDYSLYPMLVYPNPASSIITLQAENNTVPENITITDVLGKTVIEKQNSSVIDISALQAGTYFIKAQYGSNVLTQKLVKQ